VSALIHAATMVTAGIFLIARCSFVYEYSTAMLEIIAIIGATTSFFASTIGLLQNDLKRVIAYSTCSQLAYMIFACGLSNYIVGFFHLANHAFLCVVLVYIFFSCKIAFAVMKRSAHIVILCSF
jgi:NADH-ubiquinone oxidoreductase chain 5